MSRSRIGSGSSKVSARGTRWRSPRDCRHHEVRQATQANEDVVNASGNATAAPLVR